MALVMTKLMETQDRFRPFLNTYRTIMETDPALPGNSESGERNESLENNQTLLDGVAECMHFLSHANHALSDITIDLSQAPPRNLRGRPMLFHSGLLQAGMPIQVEVRKINSLIFFYFLRLRKEKI